MALKTTLKKKFVESIKYGVNSIKRRRHGVPHADMITVIAYAFPDIFSSLMTAESQVVL